MYFKLNSLVHLLAFLPGLIALVMTALGTAPFTINPAVPWALLLLSAVCVYASNFISSIFSSAKPAPPGQPPAPPAA